MRILVRKQLTLPKNPFLQAEEVEVVVTGQNWNEANAEAEKFLKSHPDSYFVHPYDQESTWKGHSTIGLSMSFHLNFILILSRCFAKIWITQFYTEFRITYEARPYGFFLQILL